MLHLEKDAIYVSLYMNYLILFHIKILFIYYYTKSLNRTRKIFINLCIIIYKVDVFIIYMYIYLHSRKPNMVFFFLFFNIYIRPKQKFVYLFVAEE